MTNSTEQNKYGNKDRECKPMGVAKFIYIKIWIEGDMFYKWCMWKNVYFERKQNGKENLFLCETLVYFIFINIQTMNPS